MAPKRPSHLDDPPAASSSEEQEEASSEEEDPSEDEEEEEEEPKLVRKSSTLTSPTKKPASKPQPSDSDDDSSSDSDSDDEDSPAAAAASAVPVKPISSKAMDDSSAAAAKKPRSKPSATPSKRPSGGGGDDDEAPKASKRAKKKSGGAAAEKPDNGGAAEEPKKAAGGGGDEKKLFQRLWSEEDEIVILKGMIDFAAKKNSDPVSDMAGFHDFIKSSIHVEDFTKSQLSDKVRRLRKKYENNAKKNYLPSKPHEKKAFELSKKIWFGKAKEEPKVNGTPVTAAARSNAAKGNGKTPAVASSKSEVVSPSPEVGTAGNVDSMLIYYLGRYENRLPETVLKKGLDLVPEDKKAEFLDTWKKIEVAEADLYSRRSQAMGEQAKFIVDAFNSV